MQKQTSKNKKRFFLDTSVLLDSPKNVFHLSEDGLNEIYISNIVIKELEKHKDDGLSEKGFHAREFARAIDNGLDGEDSFDCEALIDDFVTTFIYKDEIEHKSVKINVISRQNYEENSYTNDLKIIEVAKDYNFNLITNDIYLKLEAKTLGVASDSLKKNKVNSPESILFNETIELEEMVENDAVLTTVVLEKSKEMNPWTQISVTYKTSNKQDFFLVKPNFDLSSRNRIEKLDEKEIQKLYPVAPINKEQKFYAKMMADDAFEMGIATGSTGSGKTLLAVEEGVRRVKDKHSEINGIVYLRNTVTANDKASELGFRKGDQDQKLGYFAYPLYGAINFIINNKGKHSVDKASDKTDKDIITEEFMAKNNIEVMDIAHARGTTIQNKWIIFDELQNASPDSVKLIGTRVGKGCKIIMLGDFKQVDHPYLTKNRNGLVTVLKLAKETGDIAAIQLQETIRSKISEWFDKHL